MSLPKSKAPVNLTTCVINPTESLHTLLPRYFEKATERLSQYGLTSNLIEIIDQELQFPSWLEKQGETSIGLLILGSNEMKVLSLVRDASTGRNKHKAMHPYGRIIGWSIHLEASASFEKAKADGFILKGHPLDQLTDQILTILDGRLEKSWVAVK